MAKVPFQREIEDLFASDKSVIFKVLGGAFVSVALFSRMLWRDAKGGAPPFSPTVKVVVLVGAAITGALVVIGLLLRDVVVRRVQQGQSVNPLLRAYFGQGNGCLMAVLWFFTVILVTLVATLTTSL